MQKAIFKRIFFFLKIFKHFFKEMSLYLQHRGVDRYKNAKIEMDREKKVRKKK